jgi:uncharacterized pyridoxal phosphate-containing UPF0001 family protein
LKKGALLSGKIENALSIIINCLGNIIIYHLQSCRTYHEAQEELCKLYEIVNVVIKIHFINKLQSLKMKETNSVTKHVHSFQMIFEQF